MLVNKIVGGGGGGVIVVVIKILKVLCKIRKRVIG